MSRKGLFAVGLSIFLWDIHTGVAIPVAVSTGVTAILYGICTILPFYDTYCPYGTTLTKICAIIFRINLQSTTNEQEQDEVTRQQLNWMITNCETPRSVDVALQSIAGAADNLPMDIQKSTEISTLIQRRFISAEARGAHLSRSLLLYSRALLFLEGVQYPNYHISKAGRSAAGRLEIKLWNLQFEVDGYVIPGSCKILLSEPASLSAIYPPIRTQPCSTVRGCQNSARPSHFEWLRHYGMNRV